MYSKAPLISIIEMGDRKVVNIQKVSPLEWVVMEEKLSETCSPLIDVENEYRESQQCTYSGRLCQMDGPLAAKLLS